MMEVLGLFMPEHKRMEVPGLFMPEHERIEVPGLFMPEPQRMEVPGRHARATKNGGFVPGLFMPEPQRMKDFMDDDAMMHAARPQREHLHSPSRP
jgi:hypothetical protein